MNTAYRIGLLFSSLLLGVALFSVFFCLTARQTGAILFILKITMIFALPVCVVCLPLVLALKDAEEGRVWGILLSGILTGPAALIVLAFILQLKGRSIVLNGNGQDVVLFQLMAFAIAPGFRLKRKF